jgi:hypothetical protein
MIAIIRQPEETQTAGWHPGFLKMLPTLERYARVAFRGLRNEAKEDAVCEAIANCLCAYRRLYERNALQRAFPSALVRFAAAQYRVGRHVGNSWCSRDVYATRARQEAGVEIRSLEIRGKQHDAWLECLKDDGQTPVPDQAHFRIEFPRWLGTQTIRNRQIAETLALGYSTGEVARKFDLSPARVSQLRRELYDSWNTFTGEHHSALKGLDARENGGHARWT